MLNEILVANDKMVFFCKLKNDFYPDADLGLFTAKQVQNNAKALYNSKDKPLLKHAVMNSCGFKFRLIQPIKAKNKDEIFELYQEFKGTKLNDKNLALNVCLLDENFLNKYPFIAESFKIPSFK